MTIKPITNRSEWNDFVVSTHPHTFLHSWEWGVVQEEQEGEVVRLGAYEAERLVALALVIVVRARRGTFLFVPHGPLVADGYSFETAIREFATRFREEASRVGASFIRVSPLAPRTAEYAELFRSAGFRAAPIYMHAENTWMLPLEASEEELLAGMRKTTRNLVRRAQKDGVTITKEADEKAFAALATLYQETARKHGFTPFSMKFVRAEYGAFAGAGEGVDAYLYTAWYEGTPLSSALVIHFGESAYYHHGANALEHAKIPSSYALQWEAIRDAKSAGKKYYNFWGIAEDEDDPNHPWAGLTLFKKGFGGFRTDYLHAQDMPLSWRYWISWVVDTIRMRKRGV